MYNIKALLMNNKCKLDSCTTVQHLLYADNMAIIGANYEELNCLMNTIENNLKIFGLKINIDKTKRMTILPKQKKLPKQTSSNNFLKNIEVKQFKYLGAILTDEVELNAEVDARVNKASIAFGCLNKLVWYQPAIKHSTKFRLFKALILCFIIQM